MTGKLPKTIEVMLNLCLTVYYDHNKMSRPSNIQQTIKSMTQTVFMI